ncbi:uncharacterized protein LOC127847431 [Dreissena polymorpha]|uniref:Uncharacterized protein n=1 Tax=Dreissena polymorpha TaxID=45954 RepID=A0A9D4DVU7_DREPO|nr:uncharacterized protein LOC127847431 [Dreissena polymorpha]KAH3755270.1 hypothetical protein DPMN_189961 [Dreissena polymorpha]
MRFSWDIQETKFLKCDKDQTPIGQCSALTVVQCGVEETYSGVYNIASNNDLTSTTITLITYKEDLSGNYSCFKDNNADRQTVCLTTERTSEPSTGATSNAFLVVGIIIAVCVPVVITVIICFKCKKHIKITNLNVCSSKR